MRAAPAVSCANVHKNTHTSIQGSGGDPTFPAQWLYGLFRAHPGVSGFPAPVASRNLALRPGRAFAPPKDLTPTIEASGPHDFAVRFGTARQRAPRPLTEFIPPCNPIARAMPSRPPHPIPTFGDDGQRPFLWGQDAVIRRSDLPDGTSEILPVGLICRRQSSQSKMSKTTPCKVTWHPLEWMLCAVSNRLASKR
jgi:hypothetical protein